MVITMRDNTSETKIISKCQSICDKYTDILKVRKTRVILGNVKGARCKGVKSAHIHINLPPHNKRVRRIHKHGVICINKNNLLKLKSNELKKIMADEVAHLTMRRDHQHRNKTYQRNYIRLTGKSMYDNYGSVKSSSDLSPCKLSSDG
mgnify:CR=1 FL=1